MFLKFRFYENLLKEHDRILQAAQRAAKDIGIPHSIKGGVGLCASGSACPALLRSDIIKSIQRAARKPLVLSSLVDDIRTLIKSYYGDEYDAVPVNSCEAALWLFYHVLVKPSTLGSAASRSKCIGLYEKHIGMHHLAYGIPFPPRYKDLFSERGATSGELGILGRRVEDIEIIIMELEGAKYPCHGIKYHPTPLLTNVDPDRSIEKIQKIAKRHITTLSAIVSLGYDTVGYGYGIKDPNGTPVMQQHIGELARDLDLIYLTDNACGIPFVGTDIRANKAHLMTYSMDKVAGAPISGLIMGEENIISPLRRAMGFHSDRQGSVSAYGKALGSFFDPGKEGLVGQITALERILKAPDQITEVVDHLYEITLHEFKNLRSFFGDGILISKSYNSASIEINYEKTWETHLPGIPIFPIEDRCAGKNLISACLHQMGIITSHCDDGNILISPGLGTCDENGRLLEKNMRYAIKALAASIEIICKYGGLDAF